jgi:hypothetical protein
MDCGPFGWGGAGHSHSDTLSVVAWLGTERIFIDPGTYTYVGDPVERDWFRGSSAHNTVCIDGRSQAQPQGPFRWASKPEVSLDIWKPSKDGGLVQGTCRYAGFTHRRRVLLKPHNVLVFDEIEAPAGDHTCQQIWQLGPAAVKVRLAFSAETSRTEAVYSPAYGRKESGSAITARFSGPLPARMAMLVQLEGTMSKISIEEAQHMLGDPVFAAS